MARRDSDGFTNDEAKATINGQNVSLKKVIARARRYAETEALIICVILRTYEDFISDEGHLPHLSTMERWIIWNGYFDHVKGTQQYKEMVEILFQKYKQAFLK